MKVLKSDILDFADEHYKMESHVRWNGRQIRNAFHIAIALAENEAIEKSKNGWPRKAVLKPRHFLVVEDASSSFDSYLFDVLGSTTHSGKAQQQFLRHDGWKGGNPPDQRSKRRDQRDSQPRTQKARSRLWDDSSSSDSGPSDPDSFRSRSPVEEGTRKRYKKGENDSGDGEEAEWQRNSGRKGDDYDTRRDRDKVDE